MEGNPLKPKERYQYEDVILKEKEFFERFNNFHLFFVIEDPEYLKEMKEIFMQDNSELYRELNVRMKDKRTSPQDLAGDLKLLLYKAYLILREKGFSNKDVGLKYW